MKYMVLVDGLEVAKNNAVWGTFGEYWSVSHTNSGVANA